MQLDSPGFRDFLKAFGAMPEEEKKKAKAFADKVCGGLRFVPNPGPQTDAYHCLADELFYGGAGGGGKTSLLCGLPVNEHHDIQLFRREGTQLRGLVKELTRIIGSTTGFNSQLGIWRLGEKTIELAGVKDEGDKEKWQGRGADFKGFDEITHFTRSQYRFIIGWNRSTRKGQRCRVVATGNPPLTVEGLWVIAHWAPWLDPNHPDPAKPGELRWPVRANDDENDEAEIFFRTKEEAMAHMAALATAPRDYEGNLLPPRSRTFIPAALEDNPDLMRSGYASVIESMPKELRAALKGSFNASLKDQPFQVIPSEWIKLAQERWREDGWKDYAMTAMGFDPAGGGRDSAELAWRHGGWYAHLVSAQGKETADGSLAAATIVQHRRDSAPVVVDAGGGAGHGFGGTTIMRLKDNGVTVEPYNGTSKSHAKSRDGQFHFFNERAAAWWKLREDLDPDQAGGSIIALPPDPELRADLAAPTYEVTAKGIKIEDKDEIRKRLGRSPGKGDAVVMCWAPGHKAIKKQVARSGARTLPRTTNPNNAHYASRRKHTSRGRGLEAPRGESEQG